MKKLLLFLFIISLSAFICSAQPAKAKPAAKKPLAAKPAIKPSVDLGKTTGRTYRNEGFKFEITFPDTWLVPDRDFEDYMKKQGFDISLKAPDTLTPVAKAKLNQALKRITMLVTAYRSMPGSDENAIMRVSAEDLRSAPQIKDAVDYLDVMRVNFKSMKLPADFTYSDTQAEQLGLKQFAYLDTSGNAGKKRIYATVKNNYAILFTLTYTTDDDLQTMRKILAEGNFFLK